MGNNHVNHGLSKKIVLFSFAALSFNMTYTDKFLDARWVYSKVLGITKVKVLYIQYR